MSAPATNDFSPAPVRITTRTLSSYLSSRIARRSSSSVRVLSAFSTLGRLMVTIAVASSRSISWLSKDITVGTGTSASRARSLRPGTRRTSSRRTAADRARRPWRSRRRPATRKRRRSPSAADGSALLASHRDVVGVDDDEHVEQAGDDQEGVAVLVGDGADVAAAITERAGKEVGGADAEIGERREADQRIGQLEREQPAADHEPDGEHQRQRKHEDQALAAPPEPEVAGAGDRPRRQAQKHERAGLCLLCRGCAHGR